MTSNDDRDTFRRGGTSAGHSGEPPSETDDDSAYRRDLERYRTIVEASGDAMYTLDPEGHITLVNDSFVEMVGYDRETLLGEHVDLVMTDEDVEGGSELIRTLLSTGEQRGTIEMDILTADGDAVPCENHMVLLPFEEEFRGTAGVLRDITERKRRERTLQRERDRLEKFASVISHDLRNPLAIAKGYLDIAAETHDEEAFEHIERSLDRIERIIDDVLWLAREGQDIGETVPVSLAGMIEEAWSHVAANTPEATLRYESDELGSIAADRDRLSQLLENLFRNSIEHVGSDVTVSVEAVDDGFAVEDDGPGIPDDERERVFERGYTTSAEGTGLGLHIVTEIATAHGWEITLSSGEAGGARFEFHT